MSGGGLERAVAVVVVMDDTMVGVAVGWIACSLPNPKKKTKVELTVVLRVEPSFCTLKNIGTIMAYKFNLGGQRHSFRT